MASARIRKSFPRLVFSFASYPSTVKDVPTQDGHRFLDMATCVGSIPVMLDDVMAAIGRNMRLSDHIGGGGRTEVPEYPSEALREALINAVMHRDYSDEALGSAVQADLYPDRIEIMNPGGFYDSTAW